ncbi:MAG: FAD-dependent oxidoreductase, partial [Solirubrobacterales bacterium]
MAGLPAESRFVIVGGGVHGLSAAWHLARELRERGEEGSVVLLERDRLGSGASGISGGIVRNYYRSEAMTGVIAESVGIFESDPEGFGFHQVGYLAVVPERQREDLEAIAARQAEVGYDSELVVGHDAAHRGNLTLTAVHKDSEVNFDGRAVYEGLFRYSGTIA